MWPKKTVSIIYLYISLFYAMLLVILIQIVPRNVFIWIFNITTPSRADFYVYISTYYVDCRYTRIINIHVFYKVFHKYVSSDKNEH